MLTSAVLLAAKTQEDDLFKTSVAQLRVLYVRQEQYHFCFRYSPVLIDFFF